MSDLPPIRDRLTALGLMNLGKDAAPDSWVPGVEKWARKLRGGSLRRAAEEAALVKVLRSAGVQAPRQVVRAALADADRERAAADAAGRTAALDPETLLDAGRAVLASEDQLVALRRDVRVLGFAGDTSPVELLHLALGSRFLERPINLAVEGPSAAGKSFSVDTARRFHPPEAVHVLTASSERAAVYSDFDTQNAYVIVSEASGLHRDGIGATIVRGLAWGEGLRYEVVEKVDGELRARVIEKPGPTGLITTTTRELDPEVATRLLRVQVTDSPEQTRAVVRALAESAGGTPRDEPAFEPWVAAHRWLGIEGERRVHVPFAPALAEQVPVDDVRMRRDFEQVLAVVRAHAFMHQQTRTLDSRLGVVAEQADYAAAYRLLSAVLAITLDQVSEATRETVTLVAELTEGLEESEGVSYPDLAAHLPLSTSGAWRRAQPALRAGWLVNVEPRSGYPARLRPGDPMPEPRAVLPTPEELFGVDPPRGTPETGSTLNAPHGDRATARKTGIERGVESAEALSQRSASRNASLNGPNAHNDTEKPEGIDALSEFSGGTERIHPLLAEAIIELDLEPLDNEAPP